MQCCSAMGLVVQVLKTNSASSDLSHHFHRALTPRTTVLSLWAQVGGPGTMETMPLTHGRNARAKPGNGTTLTMRQGSPRRSERYRLSISCCILSRWPMATGQALPVLLHLECTVPASLLSSPSPPKGCPQTRCNTIIRVREREDLLLASPSTSIACLLQVIFHTIYTSNTPMCPVQLCYAVL